MSSLLGRLREVVAYESLDDIGSKLCLISIWQLQRLTPCFKCFVRVKSQFREKIRYYQLGNFNLLYYPGIIQFSLYYLSRDRLREVYNKRIFQTFSSKSTVVAVAHERWSLTRGSKYSDLTWKLWYFGKLVAEERRSRSLMRGGHHRTFDCINFCVLQ